MVNRVEGENLQAAWPMLSEDAKTPLAEQTMNFLQQLRNLQSGKMANIGQAPLYSGWLFLQGAGTLLHQKTSYGSLSYANWRNYQRKRKMRFVSDYLYARPIHSHMVI